MTVSFKQRLGAIALVAAVAVSAGCASPAQKDNMTAVPTATVKQLPYSVAVEAKGGAETGAMDSTNVSNEDLKAAIEASIAKSNLFKTVVQGKNGDYQLSVTVTQLQKPMFGGAFTVTLEAGWSLVHTADQRVVMRKVIRSSHTAQLSDSLAGVTRLRLAVEGAVRNNIAQGLQEISQLPL